MTYGILSDIHSNLTALQAVLDELVGVDRFICLGDVVGYGPDPAECLSLVRSLGCISVLGNHDAAVAGLMDPYWLNPYAGEAVLWTRKMLTKVDARLLGMLPLKYEGAGFVVVHASLSRPEEFPYIVSRAEARECFDEMTGSSTFSEHQGTVLPFGEEEGVEECRVCFVGHSHKCEVYVQHPPHASAIDRIDMFIGGKLDLQPGLRYIVNCGSVGQPRDGNPMAACAIFDSEARTVEIIRVPYDIGAVQDRMRRAGLSPMLIDRLEYGF